MLRIVSECKEFSKWFPLAFMHSFSVVESHPFFCVTLPSFIRSSQTFTTILLYAFNPFQILWCRTCSCLFSNWIYGRLQRSVHVTAWGTAHILRVEIKSQAASPCVLSHQGGQRGQVHADGEHATGQSQLTELSLSLG